MPVHVITTRYAGKISLRIDELLQQTLPGELARLEKDAVVSNSKIRRLIVAGAVSINGQQTRNPATPVSNGKTVTIKLDTDKFSFEKQPDDIAFELTDKDVLFEDDVIIVVNKPAGIPTEATMVASRDHLHAAVRRYLARRAERETGKSANEPYVGVHHRLDRETSGVILFTKTRAVNEAVHAMFLEHAARKEYEALTIRPRVLPQREFNVENELGRISPKSAAAKWGAVNSGGDRARTNFSMIEPGDSFLRIRAMPVTGRTHQIRVHLAGIGLPLLGDTLYGGPATIVLPATPALNGAHGDKSAGAHPKGSAGSGGMTGASAFLRSRQTPSAEEKAASNRTLAAVPIPRVMLHAKKLTFPHPVTGEQLCVEAPLPDDFLALIGARAQADAAFDTPPA
jgi:23S rRNA pseudouridine1911/1915/1917 synthase